MLFVGYVDLAHNRDGDFVDHLNSNLQTVNRDYDAQIGEVKSQLEHQPDVGELEIQHQHELTLLRSVCCELCVVCWVLCRLCIVYCAFCRLCIMCCVVYCVDYILCIAHCAL